MIPKLVRDGFDAPILATHPTVDLAAVILRDASHIQEDSKTIKNEPGSSVMMSASGMCTAGRIKLHLRSNISRPESTILFVGSYPHDGLTGVSAQRTQQIRILIDQMGGRFSAAYALLSNAVKRFGVVKVEP